MSVKGDLVMTTQHGGHRVIVAAVALALVCSWITPALAQAPPGDFASVVSAARAWPGISISGTIVTCRFFAWATTSRTCSWV